MSLRQRITVGEAHIGRLGYILIGKIFAFSCKVSDGKRLKNENYDYSDIRIQKDIRYREGRNKYHLLNIYDKSEEKLPCIFNLHGGALVYGDKDLNRSSNCELARLGYRVIAPSYRLSPNASFLDIIEDVISSLNFIYANKDKYNIDFDNFYITGDSAGGLLAYLLTLLLTDPSVREAFRISNLPSITVKGLALYCPAPSLSAEGCGFMKRVAISGREKKAPGYEYMDKTEKLVDHNLPKTLLFTGEGDFLRTQVIAFHELLKEKGVESYLYDYPQNKDNEIVHVFPMTYPKAKESQDVFSIIRKEFQ